MIISSINTIQDIKNYKTFNKNRKQSSLNTNQSECKSLSDLYPKQYIPAFSSTQMSRDEKFAKEHEISLECAKKFNNEKSEEVRDYIKYWMPYDYRRNKQFEYLIDDNELTVDRLKRISKIGKKGHLKPLLAMAVEKMQHNLTKNIQRLSDELNIPFEDAKIYNDYYLSIASINPTEDENEIGLNAIKGYGREKFDLAINFVMPIVAQEREIEYKNHSPLQYHWPYRVKGQYISDSGCNINEKKPWKPMGWAIPDMKVPNWYISSSRLKNVPYNKEERNWPLPAQNTILFGPEGSGKTYIINKVCEHLQHFGVNVESIKFSSDNSEENCKKIRETFINGYERYKETGKYTVIKFEDDLEYYSTELQEIASICDKINEIENADFSYSEIGVFTIGTTENLKNIDGFGLSNYSIPIGIMKDFNVGEMLKFSLMKHGEKESAKEFDCKKINETMKEDLLLLTPAEIELMVKRSKRHKKTPEQKITADSILNEMYKYEQSGQGKLTADDRKTFRKDRKISSENNKNCNTYSDKIIERSTVEEDIDKMIEHIGYGKIEYGHQLFDLIHNSKYDYSSLRVGTEDFRYSFFN